MWLHNVIYDRTDYFFFFSEYLFILLFQDSWLMTWVWNHIFFFLLYFVFNDCGISQRIYLGICLWDLSLTVGFQQLMVSCWTRLRDLMEAVSLYLCSLHEVSHTFLTENIKNMTVVFWEHTETYLKPGRKKLFPIGNLDSICVQYVKYINLDVRRYYTNAELRWINKYMNIRIMPWLFIIIARSSK